MEKGRDKRIISVLMTLTIIFTLMGGTLSYLRWQTSEGQKTNVVFTVNQDFSCAADGGGNIQSATLMPASCTCLLLDRRQRFCGLLRLLPELHWPVYKQTPERADLRRKNRYDLAAVFPGKCGGNLAQICITGTDGGGFRLCAGCRAAVLFGYIRSGDE